MAVALALGSCGQAAPNPASTLDDGGLAATAAPANPAPANPALPEPPKEPCAIELACDQAIQDEPKVDCDIVISVGLRLVYDGKSAIEKRGRSSLAFPKSNYAVELREDDGTTNRPVDLMGFGQDEDWVLDGSWADRSFMRNSLVSDLFQAFSVDWYAPQSGFCELTLNGDYQGVYRLVERIKQGAFRVDLHKDEAPDQGFVIHQDEDGSLRFELGLEGRWDSIYPKEPNPQQHQAIQTWLNDLERALKARSEGADGVFGLLDRQNVIDWILVQEFAKNIDAYKLSVYLTRDSGGLGRLVPWDLDLAFGQPEVMSGSEALRVNHESSGWIAERTPFIRDVSAVPGFSAALAGRWRQLRNGPLNTGLVLRQLAAYEAVLAPLVAANFERWPLQEVRFEPIYGPYHLYEVTSFDDEVSRLTMWIADRLAWLDANIDTFSQQ